VSFEPDYTHFADVMRNRRPARLPLYEHIVSPNVMEQILGTQFVGLAKGDQADRREYFRRYCGFFKEMSYDVATFEVSSAAAYPKPHAMKGGKGPVQTRSDFDAVPWDEINGRFWSFAGGLDLFIEALPRGMKAVGGIGNGIFETAENLVGLEYLPFIQVDDPELYADIFRGIGNNLVRLWQEFLPRYGDAFVACRIGDDLGFKSSLLTNPPTVREHILPQYRRIIEVIHAAGKPFLWHSCGCIFEVMDEFIEAGIDAKHSNEDAIAPFSRWIEEYGDRIGLIGGFDMDFLCQQSPDTIRSAVAELGAQYRNTARGYALGSGNSIPDYVPAENYLAMIEGARIIRERER
jgi:uroporphyrinogen decarboxylase